MKKHVLSAVVVLATSSFASAQEPAAPAIPATPLLPPGAADTAAPSADDAWAKVQAALKEPGKLDSKEKLGAFYGGAVEKLSGYIADFPDSPHMTDARLLRGRLMFPALQFAKPQMTVDDVIKDLQGLTADDAVAQEIRQQAGVLVVQYVMMNKTPEELDKELDAFESAFPEAKMPTYLKQLLAKKLETQNPERAKAYTADVEKAAAAAKAAQEEAQKKMEAYLNKPLDLKFTAVDGTEVDLQKMHGKVVLVDFWATWCGPCMKELPHVLEAYEKYHKDGFEIVGISFDQDKNALLKTTKEKGMTWPQYFDGKGWKNQFGQEFGIQAIPRMWLVDKGGVLVDVNGRDDLARKVGELLAK